MRFRLLCTWLSAGILFGLTFFLRLAPAALKLRSSIEFAAKTGIPYLSYSFYYRGFRDIRRLSAGLLFE